MDIIQGGDKLVQDLACCILEPMGTDSLHPTFGSTIGGGINADGSYNPGVIGTPNDAVAATAVLGEVTRIGAQYQAQQQQRFQADVAVYGKGTITANEALLSVGSIAAIGDQTTLQISAQLETGTGTLPIAIPVSSS